MTDLSDELAVSVQVALWQAMEHLGYTPTPDAVRELRIAAIAAYEAAQWRPIEELEAGSGEVLGWTDGCGYEVVRAGADGHRYSGAFAADWVRWFRPLPAPPVGEG